MRFGRNLSFEEEQMGREKANELHQRVQASIDAFDGKLTPQKLADVINAAATEIYEPNDGELRYEMDDYEQGA